MTAPNDIPDKTTDPLDRPRTLGFMDDRPDVVVNRAYSAFIKVFRKSLVFIALLLILAVVIWLVFLGPEKEAAEAPPTQSTEVTGEAALIKAQYDGVDLEQRPYRVTADRAMRSTQNEDLIEMTQPMADIFSAEDTWLAAESETGQFNQETSILTLMKNVKLFYDQGAEFTLPDITIDLKNNTAETFSPVDGQGGAGRIQAEGMKIENAGAKIIFKGPATLTLYKNDTATPTKDAQE